MKKYFFALTIFLAFLICFVSCKDESGDDNNTADLNFAGTEWTMIDDYDDMTKLRFNPNGTWDMTKFYSTAVDNFQGLYESSKNIVTLTKVTYAQAGGETAWVGSTSVEISLYLNENKLYSCGKTLLSEEIRWMTMRFWAGGKISGVTALDSGSSTYSLSNDGTFHELITHGSSGYQPSSYSGTWTSIENKFILRKIRNNGYDYEEEIYFKDGDYFIDFTTIPYSQTSGDPILGKKLFDEYGNIDTPDDSVPDTPDADTSTDTSNSNSPTENDPNVPNIPAEIRAMEGLWELTSNRGCYIKDGKYYYCSADNGIFYYDPDMYYDLKKNDSKIEFGYLSSINGEFSAYAELKLSGSKLIEISYSTDYTFEYMKSNATVLLKEK